MAFDPEAGLVVRYDFLWSTEKAAGREQGTKDRPCAIIMTRRARPEDGVREVFLLPITHTEPEKPEQGTRLPPKVAKHLGLDNKPMWIKNHEANIVEWPKDTIPHGITQTEKGEWSYGKIPSSLGKAVFQQFAEHARSRQTKTVRRNDGDAREQVKAFRDQMNQNRLGKGRDDRDR